MYLRYLGKSQQFAQPRSCALGVFVYCTHPSTVNHDLLVFLAHQPRQMTYLFGYWDTSDPTGTYIMFASNSMSFRIGLINIGLPQQSERTSFMLQLI